MPSNFNQTLRTKFVEEIIDNISNNDVSYYIGFGKNTAWDDDQNPPSTNSSIQSYFYDVQRDLIFGKKLSTADVAFIIRKITWTANTVYDQYSHIDPDLYLKSYYVLNSSNRVYKCLFNNYGSPSTIEPQGASSIGDFNTADGYKWKYLYTLPSSYRKKFTSPQYIAVINDDNVKNDAEIGAIHVCMVSNNGGSYISSNGQIDSIIDLFTYKLPNTGTSSIGGSYTQSTFYTGGTNGLSLGTSQSIITDYTINSSGRFISTLDPITYIENNTYYICPYVEFIGDGSGAFALSYINETTGEINDIKMIAKGSGYNYCTTDIISNTYFGANATAYPIISPKGGHGSNNMYELGTRHFGISVSTNPSDNLYSWATYRQASLLYNPKATSNNELYKDVIFNQITNLSIVSFSGLMGEGEVITGSLSGATATVVYMDSTSIYVKNVIGTFQPYETLTGYYTGEIAVVSSINNQDVVPYSAEVFYYKNIEPISRQGITTEQIKVYFSI